MTGRRCGGQTGKFAAEPLGQACGRASAAVNRRLLLPGSWDPASPKADPAKAARRDQCAAPAEVGRAETWQLTLDMIDETRSWVSRRPMGPRPAAGSRHAVCRRSGPPTRTSPCSSGFRLSHLPANTPLPVLVRTANTPPPVLVRTAKLRRRIESDHREMEEALGPAHFEGRTRRGRHHHNTLVPVAHAFCTPQRLTRPAFRKPRIRPRRHDNTTPSPLPSVETYPSSGVHAESHRNRDLICEGNPRRT
ncbi:transposase [Streptomyces sp. VB1]|uniref:transposase n=1 Tax=Streptomyces sp. VB1 TaxID=2986803 RepID=UPI003A1018AB